MNKALIFGASGFVGSYLIETLIQQGDQVVGTSLMPTVDRLDLTGFADHLLRCDIRYQEQTDLVVSQAKPSVVYLLSAQSYPALSWSAPAETLETNVIGTTNVFESLRKYAPTARVIVACSSAQYGEVAQKDIPVREEHPMLPVHPYGVSKVATELLAYQYWKNYGIGSICARIFNTTGPRKTGDVASDFVRRVVNIEVGLQTTKVLKVGNLENYRAITDVRDLVRALLLLAQKGSPGQSYNISGKTAYRISDILEVIRDKSKTVFEVESDEALRRKTDEVVIFGDSRKLYKETGWQPQYDLETTIADMFEYWRGLMRQGTLR